MICLEPDIIAPLISLKGEVFMKVFEVEKELKEIKALHRPFGGDISTNVMDLANYIVTKCTIDGCPVSGHELQMILFILQREALVYAASSIHDGHFEAWKQGPVVPCVYYHFLPVGYLKSLCARNVEIKGV